LLFSREEVEWITKAYADIKGTPTTLQQFKNRISNKKIYQNALFKKIVKIAKFCWLPRFGTLFSDPRNVTNIY